MFSSNLALLLWEVTIYAVAFAVAIVVSFTTWRWDGWRRGKQLFCALAQRRRMSIFVVMALVLALRGGLAVFLPTPVPGVHDEYSYIMAGETFASGRVTNPAHPLWKSMETFYVIQKPTYASMYPPAQGLALALGDVLSGSPWLGVLISAALMCGAICWMLQGWLPPHWALLGALLSVFRWGVYSYWTESYWGGAVAAAGGALVAGALPRLLRRPTVGTSIAMGVGALILANSRPFEGLLFCTPVFGFLLYKIARRNQVSLLLYLRRTAMPVFVVLLAGGSAMAFYFWRVTGNPTLMPYEVHSRTYEITGPFLWQPLRPMPSYRYAVMEQYHVSRQLAAYRQAHSVRGWLVETGHKFESLLFFYFWPSILPLTLAIPFLWRNTKFRFAGVIVLCMFVGLTLEIWPLALHYHAPLTGLMVLIAVQVIRFWSTRSWRSWPVGMGIATAIPLFTVTVLAFRVSAAVLQIAQPEHGLTPWFTVAGGNTDRAKVEQQLEQQAGAQLVFVHYGPRHHVDEEWVHNAADIDHAKVVWVRSASDIENKRVLDYYPGRHAWLLQVDERTYHLTSLTSPLINSSLR